MSLSINPLQPFRLIGQKDVSAVFLESLTQLYQPIIGAESIGVYITLMAMPSSLHQDTRRLLRHQVILLQVNIGIKELNKSREKLEAVGLLRTYRDMQSNRNPEHQTILYDLKLPLLSQEFFKNALLSTALLNQLGEKDYTELVDFLKVPEIEEDRYAEETETFQKVFYPIRVQEEAKQMIEVEAEQQAVYSPGLDYSRFLSYVMSEGINHSSLTAELKDQIYAIYDVYGNSESELANLVYLAMDKATGNVDLNTLRTIADKHNTKSASTWQTSPVEGQAQEIVSDGSNRTSQMYSKEELKMRTDQIQTQYPKLLDQDIQVVISCEQIPNDAFLNMMKKIKNAFATDSEHFYIRDLAQKTRLNEHVINFLIYYLLIIQGRPNIYKGELQRIASEWQQEDLTNVPKAMEFIKNQIKVKEIKKKQQENRPVYNKRGGSQHQEIIPSWMKEEKTSQPVVETEKPSVQYSEEELRQRLNELLGEDGES